jgi:hypothetical protein
MGSISFDSSRWKACCLFGVCGSLVPISFIAPLAAKIALGVSGVAFSILFLIKDKSQREQFQKTLNDETTRLLESAFNDD